MANNDIGHIKCPLSGHLSVVRADKRNKLYYFSQFGKITPNLPQGQKWLSEAATIWPDGVKPNNVRLESLYNGAPPVVSLTQQIEPEKALTPQSEPKREEKAPQSVTGQPVKKRKSAMSILLDGWGDDE